jgi:hypothetical protein
LLGPVSDQPIYTDRGSVVFKQRGVALSDEQWDALGAIAKNEKTTRAALLREGVELVLSARANDEVPSRPVATVTEIAEGRKVHTPGEAGFHPLVAISWQTPNYGKCRRCGFKGTRKELGH